MALTAADFTDFTGLASLGSTVLEKLAELSTVRHYSKGDLIIQEGKSANEFILIRDGKVNILTDILDIPSGGDQQKAAIQTLGKGELIGWSWVISPHEWKFDAEAITEVDAIIVDGVRLREYMGSNPEFGYQLLKIFLSVCCERLKATRIKLAVPGARPFATTEGG